MDRNVNLRKLFIYGSNLMNNEILKLVDEINSVMPIWNVIGFIEDSKRAPVNGFTTIKTSELVPYINGNETIYIANNLDRSIVNYRRFLTLLLNKGCIFTSLVNPDIDLNNVYLGKGCIIPNGCIIGENSKLGSFITIRLGATISEDVIIEDYSFIGPGAIIGKGAILKRGSFVGQGAIVMPNVVIGEKATVGAGAIAIDDVYRFDTIVGVPGKSLKR